ncbi:MAG: UPF0280 family protein [Methanosarcinales archaeon]|nr:UPF0280 family protein [Methanosarcinales archaeon]
MLREHFELRETIVTMWAREQGHLDAAREAIRRERRMLEDFIARDQFYMLTLEPYDRPRAGAPPIVWEMAAAGAAFGIGPMSAVAGTIARKAVVAMMDAGASYAMVDNGGDICVLSDWPVLVGIYAGSSPIGNVALEVPPQDEPLGICTSSGTVGPSISFGCADAATVIARDASLADAGATALGNAVTSNSSLEECFAAVDRPGVQGALVIRGREMALWGDVPEIRRARLRPEMITRG